MIINIKIFVIRSSETIFNNFHSPPAVIRINFPSFDSKAFLRAVEALMGNRYQIDARQEDAPRVASCVTATRYAIEKASGFVLPKIFVGDLPKYLRDSPIDRAKCVAFENKKEWDLVFLVGYSVTHRAHMILHAGICLDDPDRFFECGCPYGGRISEFRNIPKNRKIASKEDLSYYSDPRGTEKPYRNPSLWTPIT